MQQAQTQNGVTQQTIDAQTANPEVTPENTPGMDEEVPTDTIPPTPTEIPPTVVPTEETATPQEGAMVGSEEPTAALEVTPTRRPTVTPSDGEANSTQETGPTATPEITPIDTDLGIGAYGAGGIVLVLMGILIAARRLRRTA
jgi:hypothetical protein